MSISAAIITGLALTLGSPADRVRRTPASESSGEPFKAALADLIDRSERIVVTEHSYETDLRDTISTEFVYATRTLTNAQRKRFATVIRGVDATLPTGVDYCAFEPHHRVVFYSHDRTPSTMEICFTCGQVEWDAKHSMRAPQALYPALEQFVTSIGLQPAQDWRARAKAELETRR